MHRFVSGPSIAVAVALSFLSMLVYNHLKKKQKRVGKEIIDGAFAPSFNFATTARVGSNQYDVFLSFRGPDTRKGFTDYLYRSLINVGTVPISVFKDDTNLEIGKDFDEEILAAIAKSKILIPIISENYASSKWCLRELVHIMECKERKSHMILPIFYKVAPSDVRYLKGSFGNAFRLQKRKNRFDEKDIEEGKRALEEVSNLHGWESEKFANGREGELVENIIKTILSKLRHDFQLDIPKHLVGVDDHVSKIRNWVDTPADHARMIGIYGMGGIGKTTLAKVIYNELLNDFVYHSFLPNIRETVYRKGIPYLQDLLIKDMLPNEHQVCRVDDGISLIKSRFRGIKVLILLDDVDRPDQLYALARERDWFKTGSIIIVTTRNENVLHQPEFQVDYKCELTGLDEVHSLVLFKRHAFPMGHCPKNFEGISRDILSTMGGLPLAIKVIGAYLYEKREEKVWQDIFKKLKKGLNGDVEKTLMISYDELEPGHKKIFLDIACFFIGEDKKYAIYMWEDCEFCPNQGIEELKLRCLIKIGDDDKFRMHDQLRDLGRSIFCQGQSPERCLKLWADQQAFNELDVPKHLVGVDHDMDIIGNWVDTPVNHARMIGIYGMGGIGKTTFAKLIYNKLSKEFVHRSFLSDISKTDCSSGICHLQNQLIKDILQIEPQVCEVEDGRDLIKTTFKAKKVLIVLDDIDCHAQLNALAGVRDWFTAGSIIIVTTRWKGLLKRCEFEADFDYEMRELDLVHSFLLFKRYAFRMSHYSEEFKDISHKILSHLAGHPLAIKVIGSYLNGKVNKKLWQDVLKKLRARPPADLQSIFQISYDALEPGHKKIFVDIACFFIGKDIKYANYMWKDCDCYPNQGIEELKLRRLIKIGDDGKFRMNDQLRNLGRSIFRQGLSPGRYLKLWVDQQAFSEGMPCALLPTHKNYWPNGCSSAYTSEQFKTLPNSRFLQLRWKALSGDFNKLFSELRWLRWFYIEPDMSSLAINLHLPELVVLELSPNKLKEDWSGWSSIMMAKQLKVLNLSYSRDLRCIPDLSAFIELEILILKECRKLEQVDPSIGKVKSLVSLDLRSCRSLKELPEEVCKLQELKELLLDYAGITKLPTTICFLRKLEKLSVSPCLSLVKIPLSIGNLSSLQYLGLGGCTSLVEIPLSIGKLSSLQNLDLSGCLPLREFPNSIGNLSSLQHLNLSHCRSLREIPNSIGNLSSLQHLNLSHCQSLREIPSSIGNLSSLQHLDVSHISITPQQLDLSHHLVCNLSPQHCSSLREIPNSIGNLSSLKQLNLSHCRSLREIPNSIGNLSSLKELNLSHCRSLREIPISIGDLQNLQHLDISNSAIEEFPNAIGRFKKLRRIILISKDSLKGETPREIRDSSSLFDIIHKLISELPDNMQKHFLFQRLRQCFEDLRLLLELPSGSTYLHVSSLIPRMPQLSCLIHLEELRLYGCNQLECIPDLPSGLLKLCVVSCPKLILPKLDRFKYLEELSIQHHNSIERMDLSQLNRLRGLDIEYCDNLVEVHCQGKLEFLEMINIYSCKSIERLILPKLQCLKRLYAHSCDNLVEIRGLDKAEFLEALDISNCRSIERLSDLSCIGTLKEFKINGCCRLRGVESLRDCLAEAYL